METSYEIYVFSTFSDKGEFLNKKTNHGDMHDRSEMSSQLPFALLCHILLL
jgi:hypothetical protein